MKIDYKTAYENVMVLNKMLEKEIERLIKQIEEYQKALDETTSEKIDLENIIKEAKKNNQYIIDVINDIEDGKRLIELLSKTNEILENGGNNE